MAILKIEGGNDLEAQLYNELKKLSGIEKKLEIYSFENLSKIILNLGVKYLDPKKIQVLSALKNELGINIVIYGRAMGNDSFELTLRNTNNSVIFNNTYKVLIHPPEYMMR